MILVLFSIVIIVAVVVRTIYSRNNQPVMMELEPLDPRDIDFLEPTPMDICPLSPTQVVGLMNFKPSPAKIRHILPDDPMEIDADYLGLTYPIINLKEHFS